MTKIENEEFKFSMNDPDKDNNDGILALAHAVLGKPDEAHLSLEETGAAEELLALASEVSHSSPINREIIQTPFETEANTQNNQHDGPPVLAQKPNTTTTSSTTAKHICNNCAATSTPFWRKSYDGLYYCNACGLYLRTHNAMRPLSLSKNRESRRGKTRPELCSNCGATDTPMWRKTEDGIVVCNACGLYHKLHGQHRRTGSKRSSTEESSSNRKPVRSNDFTIVRENSQIASKSSNTSGTAKYSLDNQYHHKFDPNRINVNQQNVVESPELLSTNANVLPIVEVQPVDARKLAYLKCSQGRTALLAPKISQDHQIIGSNPQCNNSQQSSSISNTFISSSPMPPIITSFINSLAMTSPDNLTEEQVDHPLQPLLTSIVSQKLKEQKDKYQMKIHSPSEITSSNGVNMHIPLQIYQQQQQQQQQENFNQLAEFLQAQQQAIYNQQMVQQDIYNHVSQNNGYVYNPEYSDSTGYVNYQHGNGEAQYQQFDLNNQYIMEQQQSNQPHLQYTKHQNLQGFQNIQQQLPQIQLSQIPQMPKIPQYSYDSQQQQNNGVYFTERFSEPPLRRLSPFSGIKFDKNLIDLVNMQFWQDNNGPNSNQENSSDQTNNGPF